MPTSKVLEVRLVSTIDTSDKGSQTLPLDKYLDMAYVFLKKATGVLPEYHIIEYYIDLKPGI